MSGRYFTVESELIINRKNFKEGLSRIKSMDRSFNSGGRKEIQDATGFGQALYKLGWSAIYGRPTTHIRGLVFRRSDALSRDSRYIPYTIAKVVEPGGYIKFIDNEFDISKIYRFNNGRVTQDSLKRKYIDIKSEKDLMNLLEFSIDHLYEIDKLPKDIIDFIKHKYVKKILDL